MLDYIDTPNLPRIYHRGPPLSDGPLPSVIYFSLSGEESLGLDPYNQPAVFLSERGVRVFSITLPGHEGDFPHNHAIKQCGDSPESGETSIKKFIDTCKLVIDHLVHDHYIDVNHLGVAGLSRGAYIATQLAAKDERLKTILGFAPLTTLETVKELQDFGTALYPLSLQALIPELADKKVRFHIGNYDTLVSTPRCFSFIHELTESCYQKNRRFPPIELIIYPSIGHKGHGTPPEIFLAGSEWLLSSL
jgi:esterase FrsA